MQPGCKERPPGGQATRAHASVAWAIGGGNHQDRAIHLGSTGDHVLDVVGVARSVDVSIVTLLSLVLNMRDVDRDTTLLLFRRLVDLIERRERVNCLGTCRAELW